MNSFEIQVENDWNFPLSTCFSYIPPSRHFCVSLKRSKQMDKKSTASEDRRQGILIPQDSERETSHHDETVEPSTAIPRKRVTGQS